MKATKTEAEAEVKKSTGKHLNWLWVVLVGLTLLNALIAERAEPGLVITLVVAVMIVVKTRLIIDHFMELTEASPYIYHLITAYFYVFSLLAVVVWLFPEQVASWTTLRP